MKTILDKTILKRSGALLNAVFLGALLMTSPAMAEEGGHCPDLLKFQATTLGSSSKIDFCEKFAGKPLLVVNTASQCGFTPQFEGLQALHEQYGEKLNIVGFPSDDFNQELDTAAEISDVCHKNYGVGFTMMSLSSVKGADANEFYQQLIAKSGESPSWNFNKYLVAADGSQVQHFGSRVKPQSKELIAAIDELLQ